ncbi:sensor histidine kinase [Oleiharenicola lentus]|uniref:sensor histidine kinase n=1 Tax=Oleiharenicola lentus TaxID=2508720 RepID=UPI003F66A87A
MLTASRRIFLYWLLLLLPALVVGAGAIQLLRREQARLVERGQYADEARLAAVTARTRLVVENVELLMGDIQTGLLDTLAAEPAESLLVFLDQWEKTNPFVRTAFIAASEGRLQRPLSINADEDGRGFIRRFGARFLDSPPWGFSQPKAKADLAASFDEAKKEREETAARQQVASNVFKMQNARRDAKVSSRQNSAPALADSVPAVEASAASAGAGYAAPSPAISQAREVSPERRGWNSWLIDGRLHMLGWVQPANASAVRGAEMEMVALIGRMGGALPAEVDGGEGYALRDEQGRILHQVGAIAREAQPAVRVPFAGNSLPGWDVVAFLPLAERDAGLGGSFFLVGSLLIGIFVTAIVVGGSLLLWQARRSEAEAAQKTSFVANVSHEFKTPLTTIRLYSELLEQGRVQDPGKSADYLRTIGRETQRLSRLVGNVLDFSRLEQGQKKFALEPIELTTEVGRLLDTQSPRLSEAGLQVTRHLPHAPVRVQTDRDALEQIVLNLLENACKYADRGGELTVSLEPRKEGGAVLRVMDRGPGVPPEHQLRIFEKFHRVDDTLTAEKAGAGLGLSIARQLARGLGGELRYRAREGGGAVFELQLP